MDRGVQELHAISGLSEDTWVPGGSIADDKVTRLRVNLCYLHLITVSCVLVPADRSPLYPYSIQPAKKKATGGIMLSLLSLFNTCSTHLIHCLTSILPPYPHTHTYFHTFISLPSTYSECKWLQEVRAPCDNIQ